MRAWWGAFLFCDFVTDKKNSFFCFSSSTFLEKEKASLILSPLHSLSSPRCLYCDRPSTRRNRPLARSKEKRKDRASFLRSIPLQYAPPPPPPPVRKRMGANKKKVVSDAETRTRGQRYLVGRHKTPVLTNYTTPDGIWTSGELKNGGGGRNRLSIFRSVGVGS